MTIGIRELARNSNILDGYDFVDVEDKKTHEYKGLFISPKYANEFKDFLAEKTSKERQEKLDRLEPFVGALEFEDRFKNLNDTEILIEASKAKCEN